MPQYIIHDQGHYNIFSTVVDAAYYESALTLEQLRECVRMHWGEEGLRSLPERLERAHAKGTSEINSASLRETVMPNRAGPGETEVPFEEFVARFLRPAHA